MKIIQEFLSDLADRDIKLWADGDRLRCNAPKGTLTPALRAELSEHKAEIIAFLHRANVGSHSRLEPVSRKGNLPLSFAQQRLWFLDQLEGPSATYNMPAALRFSGSLDVEALGQAFDEIVRRHEALRTTFATVDGKAVQVIAPALTMRLPVVDLGHLPGDEQRTEVKRQASKEAQRPFDLATGPLIRATLLRLGSKDAPGTGGQAEHVLLCTMHHIVADGWSIGVLVQELAELYAAFSAGQRSTLQELAIQYADYAVWQREWLSGQELERRLAYWRQQLEGAPELLELPTDRPRPPVQTFKGNTIHFEIERDLRGQLEGLGRQAGASLFMTLQAALAVLLARYSGQDDIVVGAPIAGRNRAEIEALIGLFVNTLVLRVDLSGEPTFGELLEQVRQVTLDAYANQEIPFEQLVGELQPERNLSRTPLFQVMFALQNAPLEPLDLPGLTIELLELSNVTSKFDLTVFLEETAQGLRGEVEYNTDLFDAVTIERMCRHFQTLLKGIVAAPGQPISELRLMTPAERREILIDWNDTGAEYPRDKCIQELFEEQVARTPDAIAVETLAPSKGRVTYSELNARANQLAHYLQELGVGPKVLVGLCVERSPEMMVGLWGILKAGGAFVPLDPNLPKERLSFMVQDAQAAVLLTQERLLDRVEARGSRIVCLDTAWETISRQSEHNPSRTATAQNLAYVMYTSGSTGKPKGTMIVQRGLVNYLSWCIEAYDVAANGGAPVSSSIGFDATITSLFSPLLVGQRVLLLPEGEEIDGLAEALSSRQRFSLVKITPAHLRALGHMLSDQVADCGTRAFIIGGEALMEEHLEFWRTGAPAIKLINEYGPTESVVGCCVYQAAPIRSQSGAAPIKSQSGAAPIRSQSGAVPIGRPIANTQLYILNKNLQPMPIGVPGELHIGGDGLARGYLDRPELTAEKFIQNPYSKEHGSRLYKTGDVARYLADGNIEFLGRMDFQIKLRGFRIELGEIEAVLLGCAEVSECVVVVRQDQPGHKLLVAYVVVKEDADLRSQLEQKLPDYMIPSTFIRLEELPLTPNGKIDRRALPAPDWSAQGQGYVEPRTPEEKVLADVWAEVLGLERVGIHDNFFELGGDSIISIQAVSKASQAGIKTTVRQMFDRQTVAGLARVAGAIPELQFEQGAVRGRAPLTPIQRWFFEQKREQAHHFNQSVMLRTAPDLEPEWLERAIQHLLRHHDALRMRFRQNTDSPTGWQQVNAATDETATFRVVDISGYADKEQQAAIESASEEQQSSLNLSQGPLLRAVMFIKGDEQPGRLLLVIHHLVVDGVSWRILLEDLQTAYRQLERGKDVSLPDKTASFKLWAERLAGLEPAESLAADRDYWRSREWPDAARLPVDREAGRADNTVAAEGTVTSVLDGKHTQELLQKVPSVYNTRINDVLLTGLLRAFARWTGEQKLLIDLEGHGREELFDDVDVSRTVGWFTSLYPVRLDLATRKDAEIGEALKAVKEQLRAIPRQGMGYGLLRYQERDAETSDRLRALPQAQVLFNYLGQLDQAPPEAISFRLTQEPRGPDYGPQGVRCYLLEVNSMVVDGQLRTEWTYSTRTHSPSTVERLAQGFVTELQALIAHCQSPEAGGFTPSDFPDVELDQAQLYQVLAGVPKHVESIYPLSPSQQGAFFETLSALEPGIHIEQSAWSLRGDLDLAAFELAWQRVVERHTVLRTCFVWQDQDQPLQVVLRRVKVPLEQQDWRQLSPTQQQESLDAYLEADRQRGFELDQAPLMRLAVFETGKREYQVVWTFHHILMDGWSTSMVAQEMALLFEAFSRGRDVQLEPSWPYRDYIRWLQQQEIESAQAFWKERLAGLAGPTPLGARAEADDFAGLDGRYGEQTAHLPAPLTATLQYLAQQHRLTLNTLVQGVWGMLLSRYSGETDVVFGATVSGRPADLAGIESMAGLFINTVPIRFEVSPQTQLWSWLETIQAQNLEQQPYEYYSSGQIRQWVAIPGSFPLYESILVFENYPLDTLLMQRADQAVTVQAVRSVGAQTNYALTILVTPGDELEISIIYNRWRLDDPDVSRILEHWLSALESIATLEEQRLETVTRSIPVEQIPQVRPRRARDGSKRDFVPPRNALELQLVQVWEDVLDIRPIGVRDNFFDLGGHSLLATQVVSRLRQAFQVELPVRSLFESPTVAETAHHIEKIQRVQELESSPAVALGDYEEEGEV